MMWSEFWLMICKITSWSRQNERGYYRWLKRKPSQRKIENQRLDEEIREIYAGSKGRYGTPKITKSFELEVTGWAKIVWRSECVKPGLRSKIRRRYQETTDSKHRFPVAPNLMERNFTIQTPDKVWVPDITYLATRTGWLYLTEIIDLFSRLVVGWSLSSSLSHDMVVTALKRAVTHRRPVKVLFFIRIEVSNMLARTFEKNWARTVLSRACPAREIVGIMLWRSRFSVWWKRSWFIMKNIIFIRIRFVRSLNISKSSTIEKEDTRLSGISLPLTMENSFWESALECKVSLLFKTPRLHSQIDCYFKLIKNCDSQVLL